MNFAELYDYCLSKKEAEETFPFGPETLVCKVKGKMFALFDIDNTQSVNLKCEPALALQYRELYQGVKPGWHMNKTHWNTVMLNEDVSTDLLKKMIEHSYDLIVKSLSKKLQKELE